MLSAISITIFFILHFFKLPSKSIGGIFLLFGELWAIDYFFAFLGIDSQPWPHAWGHGAMPPPLAQ